MSNGEVKKPVWFDCSYLDLADAIEHLFLETRARTFYCNLGDYIKKGWKGEVCRVFVHDGYVLVYPSAYCPPGIIWPGDDGGKAELKKKLNFLADQLIVEASKL